MSIRPTSPLPHVLRYAVPALALLSCSRHETAPIAPPKVQTNVAAKTNDTASPSPKPSLQKMPAPIQAASPTNSADRIHIHVTPFYNSENLDIRVGEYSARLGTTDITELRALEAEMEKSRHLLRPEQMFVLAIRLYDLGDKNSAIRWFYQGQLLARLHQMSLVQAPAPKIGDPGFEQAQAWGAFMQLAGTYINGYAGCDLDNWINVIRKVQGENQDAPELSRVFPSDEFVPKAKWPAIVKRNVDGMTQLIEMLDSQREQFKKQHAENGTAARFCK